MSREHAVRFIEKAEEDTRLQARIKSIQRGDWDAFQAIAKEEGFEFTVEDFHAVAKDFKKSKPGVIAANFGTVEWDTPPEHPGRKSTRAS